MDMDAPGELEFAKTDVTAPDAVRVALADLERVRHFV